MQIFQQERNAPENTIGLACLNPGIYIVLVYLEDGKIANRKLVLTF